MSDAKLMKWVGSKSAVLDQILPTLFSGGRVDTFVDAMCGPATVAVEVAERGLAKKVVAVDANLDVVGLLRHTVKYRLALKIATSAMAREYDGQPDDAAREALYYRWREEFNEGNGTIRESALMLVLNRTCFNGLYRENSDRKFNVAWGKRRSVAVEAIWSGVERVANALAAADIRAGDYASGSDPGPGVTYYFDPPYDGKFDLYGDWDDDVVRLFTYARWCVTRGARAFVSNADTPRVRAAAGRSIIHEVDGRTSVSRSTSGRGSMPELLIEVLP